MPCSLERQKDGSEGPVTPTVSLTVGTAGHIDHGKTSLVRLLTGCDTDTIPEEKARGMTIDLGFATCALPNGRQVGIVDVPGHERFVHNMVAGATGIDAVLLVVAADDGVMPQTVEHFQIVRMLGVSSGLIAVTKTDLAQPGRVEETIGQIRELVRGSFMEGCAIVPLSTKTGEGFDAFYEAFTLTVDRTAERSAEGPFRLHVESVFVLSGLGVIVSGVPCSGRVRMGDELELLPAGGVRKIKGLQVFGKDAREGCAGECVALRAANLSREEAKRGSVFASPGFFKAERFISARFRLLPGLGAPLRPRTAVRFHAGTSDVPGHLVLPEQKALAPGEETYAQFQLREPVVAAPGDFFIARLLSPVRTIGGGCVIAAEGRKLRRRKGDWAGLCAKREEAFRKPESAVLYVLGAANGRPMTIPELAREAYVDESAAEGLLTSLTARGETAELPGRRFVLRSAVEAAAAELLRELSAMHDAAPLKAGFPSKDLLPRIKCDRLVADRALAEMEASRALSRIEAGYGIPSRAPRLTERQSRLAAAIAGAYTGGGFASPREDDIPAMLGIDAAEAGPLVDYLVAAGELVRLSEKVILHKDCVELSGRKLNEYLMKHGSIESGAFKDVLGTTRKYSIPILEYWDARGLTKRMGNQRVLRSEHGCP